MLMFVFTQYICILVACVCVRVCVLSSVTTSSVPVDIDVQIILRLVLSQPKFVTALQIALTTLMNLASRVCVKEVLRVEVTHTHTHTHIK